MERDPYPGPGDFDFSFLEKRNGPFPLILKWGKEDKASLRLFLPFEVWYMCTTFRCACNEGWSKGREEVMRVRQGGMEAGGKK